MSKPWRSNVLVKCKRMTVRHAPAALIYLGSISLLCVSFVLIPDFLKDLIDASPSFGLSELFHESLEDISISSENISVRHEFFAKEVQARYVFGTASLLMLAIFVINVGIIAHIIIRAASLYTVKHLVAVAVALILLAWLIIRFLRLGGNSARELIFNDVLWLACAYDPLRASSYNLGGWLYDLDRYLSLGPAVVIFILMTLLAVAPNEQIVQPEQHLSVRQKLLNYLLIAGVLSLTGLVCCYVTAFAWTRLLIAEESQLAAGQIAIALHLYRAGTASLVLVFVYSLTLWALRREVNCQKRDKFPIAGQPQEEWMARHGLALSWQKSIPAFLSTLGPILTEPAVGWLLGQLA